jgi:hypothetical protein
MNKKHKFETRTEAAGRMKKAQEDMANLLVPGKESYFFGDTQMAKKLDISCPTVRKLRREIGVPAREDRIMAIAEEMGPRFLDEYLERMPGVTYHSLYMLLRMRNFEFLRKNK